MKNKKTIIELSNEVKSKSKELPKIPWKVWTSFWESKPSLDLGCDGQVSFNGDFQSPEEMRRSIEWLVTQFGGKVTWKK